MTIKKLIEQLEKVEDKNQVAELYDQRNETFTTLDIEHQIDGTVYFIKGDITA